MKHRLTALILALCLLTGCAGQTTKTEPETLTTEPETQATEPTQAQKEGFGLSYVAKYGFNPYSCTCLTNRPILSLAYEGLFVLNGNYEPEPVLCDSFTVSADEQTYTIKLRDDARFSDGTQVTAADAQASLEAASGSAYYGNRFRRVNSFSAQEDGTLKIVLAVPYENLMVLLDVPIVKAETVKDAVPVGSGPYTLAMRGAAPTLTRNSDWWQNDTPAIDYPAITLTAAVTPTDVRDSFEFGATSLTCIDPNSPSAIGYRCDYELWDCPTTVMQYVGFNFGSNVCSNRAFRAAITYLLDRKSIATKIYNGFAEPASLPCSPNCRLYDASLADSYAYAPESFSQVLRDGAIARGGSGIILVCSVDASRVELAYELADTLAKYGFDFQVNAVDNETYESTLKRGSYDMYIGEARLSGNFDLSEFFRNGGSLCYGGMRDDNTFAQCKATLENSGNCYELYKTVMDNGLICPILFKAYAVMATRGVISTLQPAVDSVFHLPGGRTLADATVTPEETTAETTEETTAKTTEETTAETTAPAG